MLAAMGLLLVLVSIGLSKLVGPADRGERVVVIPEGTAQRLAAGEDVALIPADLRFRLRDRLVVINDDVVGHRVGPFEVAPGGRLEKRFSEALTIEGFCSLHPGGRVRIEVAST